MGAQISQGVTAQHSWFRCSVNEKKGVAEFSIFDDIGYSPDGKTHAPTASTLLAELAALPRAIHTIRLAIDCLGGDVFEAVAIANAFRAQRLEKKRVVDVHIQNVAASAATIVTSAGTTIRMAEDAFLMIHNPQVCRVGNARELRAFAEQLDKVRDVIVATYRWVSPLSEARLKALLDAETWMNAEEAKANGFVTEITKAEPMNRLDPMALQRRVAAQWATGMNAARRRNART